MLRIGGVLLKQVPEQLHLVLWPRGGMSKGDVLGKVVVAKVWNVGRFTGYWLGHDQYPCSVGRGYCDNHLVAAMPRPIVFNQLVQLGKLGAPT